MSIRRRVYYLSPSRFDGKQKASKKRNKTHDYATGLLYVIGNVIANYYYYAFGNIVEQSALSALWAKKLKFQIGDFEIQLKRPEEMNKRCEIEFARRHLANLKIKICVQGDSGNG